MDLIQHLEAYISEVEQSEEIEAHEEGKRLAELLLKNLLNELNN